MLCKYNTVSPIPFCFRETRLNEAAVSIIYSTRLSPMILQDCSCETVANSVSRRTDVLSRGIRSTRDYTVAGGTCDQVLAVRDGSRYCHTGELVGCRYNAGRRARGEPWRTAFAPRNSCNSKYIRRANRTRAGRSSPMCDTHTPSIIS